jgi:hypothetical protein
LIFYKRHFEKGTACVPDIEFITDVISKYKEQTYKAASSDIEAMLAKGKSLLIGLKNM